MPFHHSREVDTPHGADEAPAERRCCGRFGSVGDTPRDAPREGDGDPLAAARWQGLFARNNAR